MVQHNDQWQDHQDLERDRPKQHHVLVECGVLQGEWSEKFNKNETENADFQSPGGQKKHPTMFKNAEMRYTKTDNFQLVALPFGKKKKVNLYVFLPVEGKTPVDLVKKLNQKTYSSALNQLIPSTGELKLPRFKVEYSNQLNQSLQALGMTQAFLPTADFSGMGNNLEGLRITDVQHKAVASFDEEGGEAAAVTSVGVGFECFQGEPWKMTVDRPFVAVLGEEDTGAVLFAGVVYNP